MVAPWRAEISGTTGRGYGGEGEEVRAQRDRRPTTRLAQAPARTGLGKTNRYRQRTRAAGDQPAQNEHGKYSTPKKSPAEAGLLVCETTTCWSWPWCWSSKTWLSLRSLRQPSWPTSRKGWPVEWSFPSALWERRAPLFAPEHRRPP